MAQEIADSTLLDTWSSGGNIVEPDISKIIEGWQLGEQPPHEYMNWLQNTFGSKLNHILKNGVAKWEPEKEYLAGSSVQHSGNVWLCKTTNTNSEPTDINANWKRIITVEALTTVLNGYVKNTGDETIDDIKTFLKSPIVPTPTTGTQVANKDYVDSVAVELATDAEIRTGTDNTKAITPLGYNQTTFGWGQAWQNMTASRTSGVTYTNNTGKPIMVLVSSAIGQNTGLDVVIAGSIAHSMNHNATAGAITNRAAVEFIVPSGVTYKVTAIGTAIANWNELR